MFFCFFILIIPSIKGQEKNFKKGDGVPNFKLWFTDGSKLTQNDVKGKVVVFKFWFTSCLPCVVDIPTLNSLVVELQERDDILFIAPALDRKEVITSFLKEHTFMFDVAYSAIDVSQIFNKKQVYPSYFVIDKKGKFVYIDNNSKQSHFKPLKEAILTALKD